MRTIGVITVSRSDYDVFYPVLREIEKDPDLCLNLYVGGMHLSPEYGFTVDRIEKDGFKIHDRIEMQPPSDSEEGIAKSIGLGVEGFSHAFSNGRPDILLVLGDRYEMFSAVVASVPFTIPVAHIHGGETTEGAFDEVLRHSITKMSHLHFASTEAYARRVIQMGEEPWRVTVCGAPSLDNLRRTPLLDRKGLKGACGLELNDPPLLVTYHPVTLEHDDTESQVAALLDALKTADHPVVFTYPCADTNGSLIIKMIRDYSERHASCQVIPNLGRQAYISMLDHALAMVGNSSSGIVETAWFKLPVVNIGTRQKGRIRTKNIIDVGYESAEILEGIRRAVSPEFRESLHDLDQPYGDGHAAETIVRRLKTEPLNDRLSMKRFHDLADPQLVTEKPQ